VSGGVDTKGHSRRSDSEACSKMTHLTRVVGVPSGINMLGGLEVLAVFGALAAAVSIDWRVRWASAATGAAGPGLCPVFVLGWRCGEVERASWRRLISPFTGGCFLFIPVWVWALPPFLFLFFVAASGAGVL